MKRKNQSNQNEKKEKKIKTDWSGDRFKIGISENGDIHIEFSVGTETKAVFVKRNPINGQIVVSIPSLTQMFDISCNDNIEICRAIVRDENNFSPIYNIYKHLHDGNPKWNKQTVARVRRLINSEETIRDALDQVEDSYYEHQKQMNIIKAKKNLTELAKKIIEMINDEKINTSNELLLKDNYFLDVNQQFDCIGIKCEEIIHIINNNQ